MTTDSDWRVPEPAPTRIPPLTEAAMRREQEERELMTTPFIDVDMTDHEVRQIAQAVVQHELSNRETKRKIGTVALWIVALLALVFGFIGFTRDSGVSSNTVTNTVNSRIAAERNRLGIIVNQDSTFSVDPNGPIGRAALDAANAVNHTDAYYGCIVDVITSMRATGAAKLNPSQLCANK